MRALALALALSACGGAAEPTTHPAPVIAVVDYDAGECEITTTVDLICTCTHDDAGAAWVSNCYRRIHL